MLRLCFVMHLLVLLLFRDFSYGQSLQRQSNWVFGDSVSLKFSPNPVVITGRALISDASCATISDKSGNLLFYVGRIDLMTPYHSFKVWDSTNTIFANGDSIIGPAGYQSCIILPAAMDSNKYFIFTMDKLPGFGFKLYKSLLDLSANQGTGVISIKNEKVNDTLYNEPIWAIKHGNGRDWWLLLHKISGNEFVEYLLSKDSLIYYNSQQIGNNCGFYNILNYKSNRNGNKLILTCNNGVLDLFDFDRCSGLFSNWTPLSDPPFIEFFSYCGSAFSEDDSKLYVNKYDSLFQYNLSAPNPKASRYWLFTTDSLHQIGNELLGLDGKIYINGEGNSSISYFLIDSLNTHLGVINYPNNPGSACNFAPYSFSLGGRRSFWSLPNMPNYDLEALSGSICDSLSVGISEPSKSKDSFSVFPNPVANELTIQYHLNKHDEAFLSVFDLEGREQFSEKFSDKSQELKLNMSSFQSGVYIITITCNNRKVKTEKLVVIK